MSPARQPVASRPRGGLLGAIVPAAIWLLLAAPSPAAAATLWTVAASPLTLTEGQAATVTVTVTAIGGTQIGCVAVSIPAGFTVVSAGSPNPPAPWVTQPIVSGPPAVVTFNVSSDPQRLTNGASASFSIRVIATTSPLGAWSVATYQKFNATSPSNGGPVASLSAFVIVPGPTPTPPPTPPPTPAPTPTATPAPPPTPAPTPTATPTPPPTPAPTPGATATPGPTLPPGATLPPGSTPAASDSVPGTSPGSSTNPSGVPGGSPFQSSSDGSPGGVQGDGNSPSPGTVGSGSGSGGNGGLRVASGGGDASISGLGSSAISAMSSLPGGLLPWAYPSVALAVPGLILLLAIGGQGLGAFAWLPIVRRNLGAFGIRRHGNDPRRAAKD